MITTPQVWVARYNGPYYGEDIAEAVAINEQGDVYVTGYSPNLSPYNDDYTTIKYDASGMEQWVVTYNGPGNSSDRPYDIVTDNTNHIYVTGYSWCQSGDFDYATVKYDASGAEQWAIRYNGPGNSYDAAYAIAVDCADNVYVTGWSADSSTDLDYATLKYSPAGVMQWVARYDGPNHRADWAYAIVIDSMRNVYVTGASDVYGEVNDFATVKYDSLGVQKWVATGCGTVGGEI
jgi:hypothetical protein